MTHQSEHALNPEPVAEPEVAGTEAAESPIAGSQIAASQAARSQAAAQLEHSAAIDLAFDGETG